MDDTATGAALALIIFFVGMLTLTVTAVVAIRQNRIRRAMIEQDAYRDTLLRIRHLIGTIPDADIPHLPAATCVAIFDVRAELNSVKGLPRGPK